MTDSQLPCCLVAGRLATNDRVAPPRLRRSLISRAFHGGAMERGEGLWNEEREDTQNG